MNPRFFLLYRLQTQSYTCILSHQQVTPASKRLTWPHCAILVSLKVRNLQLFSQKPLEKGPKPCTALPSFRSRTPLGCYFTQIVNQYPIMLCSTGITEFSGSKDSGSRIKLDSWQDGKVLRLGWVIKMRVQSCQALAYFIYKTPLSTILYVWQNSVFNQTLSELLSPSEWGQMITPSAQTQSEK